MISAWFTEYARTLGYELPPRTHVPGYEKGEAWVPPSSRLRGTSLEDAEELTGYGLAVFPCRSGTKKPTTKRGCLDASRDRNQLAAWWSTGSRSNLAIATGKPSGVVVVDLDGVEGIAAFARFVVAGLPPTWCALTAGGAHLYFAHPGEERLPGKAHHLAKNVDTRGDGNYVLAPPSVLAGGLPYRWLCAPWHLEAPAPLPRKVLEAWRPSRTSPPPRFEPRRSFLPGEDGDPHALAVLERWQRQLAAAPPGTRDALLVKLAYAAGARAREGRLTRAAAERALLAAVSAWGAVSPRDRAKVTRGIAAGYAG